MRSAASKDPETAPDPRADGRIPPWARPPLIAGRFLTRYPLPDPGLWSAAELGRALPWYPVVGLAIGVVLAIMAWLLSDAPSGLAAALILALWVWSTGALHLDGLADTADAWVGGLGDRERTLAIMKDPASGPVGVTALVLVLLVKLAALETLIAAAGWAALTWVPLLARAALPLLFVTTPYVRPAGMGAEQARTADPFWCRLVALAAGLLTVLVLGWAGVAAMAAAALVYVVGRRALLRRLGGFTGDTAGALVELIETLVLVVLAVTLGR